MSRKKKKNRPYVPPAAPVSAPIQQPLQNITFNSMEDKIRGEEKMMEEEGRKLKEERTIKKQLEDAEVDRRLDELRKQLGLKK